jgi:hypothetical protein
MRQTRLIGLALTIAVTLGAVLASAAAAAPEFLHGGKEVKTGFTLKGKTTTIYADVSETKYKIVCTSAAATGKVTSTTKVETVVNKFKGCKAKKGAEKHECEVKSTEPAGKKEEIVTKTLKGRLGSVAKAEAESEVGLILEPAEGEAYAVITGSTECLPKETSEARGDLIGEITPIKVEQKTGEIAYKTTGEVQQNIKKFTGESATHELELFGVKTPLESTDSIEFEVTVEIT